MFLRKTTHRLLCWRKVVLAVGGCGLGALWFGLAIFIFYPEVAVSYIDQLRSLLLTQFQTESVNLQEQQSEARAGLPMAGIGWTRLHPVTTTDRTGSWVSLGESTTTPPTEPAQLTATPASSSPAWPPSSLVPLGALPDEGQWSPYLQSPNGKPVAYRTFLLADPRRPHSITTIVAFDLRATRLHFVLGTVEPLSARPEPSRTGTIPPADRKPGVLLAAFNGGFKARPGFYGAMADGVVAQPAITGLATIAIYADGHVKMGEWGADIQDSPDLLAWRQNGVALIHNSQINPATAVTTDVWGLTPKGEAVTWRSALGLSADAQTLYYAAGAQLDVPTLTTAMAHTGAAEALQLDVNDGWVHFTAIRSVGESLVVEPLLSAMNREVDRYLMHYERDYFYVTSVTTADVSSNLIQPGS